MASNKYGAIGYDKKYTKELLKLMTYKSKSKTGLDMFM